MDYVNLIEVTARLPAWSLLKYVPLSHVVGDLLFSFPCYPASWTSVIDAVYRGVSKADC